MSKTHQGGFGGNNKWPGSYGRNGTRTGSFGGNNTGLVILVGIAMPRQFWPEQQTSCYNHYVVLVGSVLLPYYGIFGNRMAGIIILPASSTLLLISKGEH